MIENVDEIASLYVGNLRPDCNETILFDKFSSVGQILSIQVCRHKHTGISLGFAYVNYQKYEDAKKALHDFNCDLLYGQPLRITWRHTKSKIPELRAAAFRHAELQAAAYRKAKRRAAAYRAAANTNLELQPAAKVMVKNLPQSIDCRVLKDLFSICGPVLSIKIATYPNGDSRGHGYVQFKKVTSADQAISDINGAYVHGKRILVSKFNPTYHKEFPNNVFVKNIAPPFSSSEFEEMCLRYGNIKSIKLVMHGNNNVNKGYGFVSFESADAAFRAIAELNTVSLNSEQLSASIAKSKKSELE